MTKTQKKQYRAFQQAIAAEPLEAVRHSAFADWLYEAGLDDEALLHSSWSVEKHKEAEAWMNRFAERCGQTCTNWGMEAVAWEDFTWVGITYEDVLNAGKEHLKHKGEEWFTQMGKEDARDLMGNPDTRERYWQHFQVLTCIPVQTEYLNNSPFSCSC